jgi:hypothetical protein
VAGNLGGQNFHSGQFRDGNRHPNNVLGQVYKLLIWCLLYQPFKLNPCFVMFVQILGQESIVASHLIFMCLRINFNNVLYTSHAKPQHTSPGLFNGSLCLWFLYLHVPKYS